MNRPGETLKITASRFGKRPPAHFPQGAKALARGHPGGNFLMKVGLEPIDVIFASSMM
jgi:hypothetical protein